LRYLVTVDPYGHASAHEQNRRAIRKSFWSCLLYASSVPLAFVHISLSFFIFLLIPAIYFLPERKIEEMIAEL
jgi:hypothetical protein